MDPATRDFVRRRANARCEYCRLPDSVSDLPFHVEHVVATVHHVDHRVTNLAWACPRCNLRKGPNLATIDPETGERVDVFNPRLLTWSEHLSLVDGEIVGQTPIGRGTVRLLDMNNEHRLQHRRELIANGEFACD